MKCNSGPGKLQGAPCQAETWLQAAFSAIWKVFYEQASVLSQRAVQSIPTKRLSCSLWSTPVSLLYPLSLSRCPTGKLVGTICHELLVNISIFISGWRIFKMGPEEEATTLSFGACLLGKHLLSTCCLLTGVEMSNTPSRAPGSSYSGTGRLTHNQRARKPPGECAMGEDSAVDPEPLPLAVAVQGTSEGHVPAGF